MQSQNFTSNADYSLWKDILSLSATKWTADVLDWYAENCTTAPIITREFSVDLPSNFNCGELDVSVDAEGNLLICCFSIFNWKQATSILSLVGTSSEIPRKLLYRLDCFLQCNCICPVKTPGIFASYWLSTIPPFCLFRRSALPIFLLILTPQYARTLVPKPKPRTNRPRSHRCRSASVRVGDPGQIQTQSKWKTRFPEVLL